MIGHLSLLFTVVSKLHEVQLHRTYYPESTTDKSKKEDAVICKIVSYLLGVEIREPNPLLYHSSVAI